MTTTKLDPRPPPEALSDAQASRLIRMGLVETLCESDPLLASDRGALAAIRGMSADRYDRIRDALDRGLRDGARALAQTADVREHVAGLGWRRDDVVILAGDSMTADRQGWGRVIDVVVSTVAPERRPRFVHAGVGGDTTTDLLARMPAIARERPREVIAMIGTNDAQGIGAPPITKVSDGETRRNLDAIKSTLAQRPESCLRLIAPPCIRLDDIRADWFLRTLDIDWSVKRMEAKRRLILQSGGALLDAATAVRANEAGDFLDGLHPSLVGHLKLARAVLGALVRPRP